MVHLPVSPLRYIVSQSFDPPRALGAKERREGAEIQRTRKIAIRAAERGKWRAARTSVLRTETTI